MGLWEYYLSHEQQELLLICHTAAIVNYQQPHVSDSLLTSRTYSEQLSTTRSKSTVATRVRHMQQPGARLRKHRTMDDELEDQLRADPLLKKIAERDIKLAQYSILMSQVLSAQRMLRTVKQNGQTFPELDEWLILFQEYNERIVAAMNERMRNLPPLDHGSEE